MNRIERNGYTYPAWMDDDERVVELFREAEKKRSPFWQAVEIVAAWVGVIVVGGVIWYGVLRSIGAL